MRWSFVIHGGVDGYSKHVLLLMSSTNNSPTLLELFHNTKKKKEIESNVIGDLGTV